MRYGAPLIAFYWALAAGSMLRRPTPTRPRVAPKEPWIALSLAAVCLLAPVALYRLATDRGITL